jgi:hypothetical protein
MGKISIEHGRCLAAGVIWLIAASATASFHPFSIEQIYSNADGTVQYVVMREMLGSADGQRMVGAHLYQHPYGGQQDLYVCCRFAGGRHREQARVDRFARAGGPTQSVGSHSPIASARLERSLDVIFMAIPAQMDRSDYTQTPALLAQQSAATPAGETCQFVRP